jgi:hypothetical protein
VALSRPVEIAWVLAAAGQALAGLLGLPEPPMLSMTELQTAVIRVPWMGRLRNPDVPAFSVGLEGVEEEAAHIFLVEEREPLPGEPGSYRILHLDEGGYRPGLHAVLRSAGTPIGHALAAASAAALARETDGVVADPAEGWVEATGGSPVHTPDAFLGALRPRRSFASVSDAADALYARRPRHRTSSPT